MALKAPQRLVEFQKEYSEFIRNPQEYARPNGVPARQSQVYEDLLFNNVKGFINNCFPVAHSLFCEDAWLQIIRQFYSNWKAETPYFSRIPREFVTFLESGKYPLPPSMPWLHELCHYEWMELHVDTLDCNENAAKTAVALNNPLQLNPSLQLLQYIWPVHKISKNYSPETPEHTFILVFRNNEDQVKFININAVSALLLDAGRQTNTIHEALEFVAEKMGSPFDENFKTFGLDLLNTLARQQALRMFPKH